LEEWEVWTWKGYLKDLTDSMWQKGYSHLLVEFEHGLNIHTYLIMHLFACRWGKKEQGLPTLSNLIQTWLHEAPYDTLVRDVWNDTSYQNLEGAQYRLISKLNCLRARSKIWLREKRNRDSEEMASIERDLDVTSIVQGRRMCLIEDYENKVKKLEVACNKNLLEEEERWRLKSRAIMDIQWRQNTKFFHRFASFRRNKKHLWEIEDEEGRIYQKQEDIKNSAINYFKSFYQAEGTNILGDQVDIVRLFPRMVKEEEVKGP
jgi:hypothetical protein